MNQLAGTRIHITGVVQGVGFRPFVYGLAKRLQLTGWVRNTSAGVDIEAVGPLETLEAFALALTSEAPPLARIDSLDKHEIPANGYTSFEIKTSQPIAGSFQPISPDMSICTDCHRELFDPNDRRYRYPFINCTNCGPRFTIIEDIPYDRPLTTMADFPMCADCEREYKDPLDRRFHAQPVACPACGPRVWFEELDSPHAILERESAIRAARRLLTKGRVVAIKGLGGFHLACDATNAAAVAELRKRKLRVDKPFAVMMWDTPSVARHCNINGDESAQLTSHERPIVILARREETKVVSDVAPGQPTMGVMLPYTPLHYLLLEPEPGFPDALVMTSGNLSEEPIAFDNEEARTRLAALADGYLLHDRDIRTRCDDSVVRVLSEDGEMDSTERHLPRVIPIRRSRGYAPFPVKLPLKAPPLLATGAELKNTFCITRAQYAFLSHHVGDMENYETLLSFEDGVKHFERLFRVRPEAFAYDLHPGYLATRYAQERAQKEGLPAFGVQHHYSHIVACLAEHNHPGDRPVIGVAFDGTGYGEDGAIWGGEFLLADYHGYQRVSHLNYVPLPGGDLAIREPWRMALAWLHKAGIEWSPDLPPLRTSQPSRVHLQAIRHQLESGLNAPPTSSIGRLFDAVAALAGVRGAVNYEAQAAIELEVLVDPSEDGYYPFNFSDGVVDAIPLIAAVVDDLHAGEHTRTIAARFHNSVARMVNEMCRHIRQQHSIGEVALSGGVWQNMTLLARTIKLLRKEGFTVLIHHLVPANDGGLALGQAVATAARLGV